MDAIDRYEALAAEFYNDTGAMAPGKDVSPADNGPKTGLGYRQGAWDVWKSMRSQLAALTKQRDELLEAAEKVIAVLPVDWAKPPGPNPFNDLRAAIANMKEGK